jgi:hypothetical protein
MSDHTHRQSRCNSGTEPSRWTGLLTFFFVTNTHLQHLRERKCGRPPDTPRLSPVQQTQDILGPLTSSGSSRSPSGQYARPFTARTDVVQFPVRPPLPPLPRKQGRAGLPLRGAKTGEGLAGHAPKQGLCMSTSCFVCEVKSILHAVTGGSPRAAGFTRAGTGCLHPLVIYIFFYPAYVDRGLRSDSLYRVLSSLYIPTGGGSSEGPA